MLLIFRKIPAIQPTLEQWCTGPVRRPKRSNDEGRHHKVFTYYFGLLRLRAGCWNGTWPFRSPRVVRIVRKWA